MSKTIVLLIGSHPGVAPDFICLDYKRIRSRISRTILQFRHFESQPELNYVPIVQFRQESSSARQTTNG
jgi:hypothetical protein